MEKLLSLIGTLTLVSAGSTPVIACNDTPPPSLTFPILSGYWFGWKAEPDANDTPLFTRINTINKSYNVVNVSFWFASTANTIPIQKNIFGIIKK